MWISIYGERYIEGKNISVVIVIILMERAKDGWWQPKYEKEALLP